MECDITSWVVGFYALGQQTVQRESLVIAPRHQAFNDKAPDLLDRNSLHDKGVETVEGPEKALNQPATFWRVWVGVRHMHEIGRQGWRAMHCDRVALLSEGRIGEGRNQEA